MDREDARRLSPAEQHERRRQVIRAYKRKLNKRQIARDVDLSYLATCEIIGRRSGDKHMLSTEQESADRHDDL